MKVISLVSQKGGAGKTTACIHLAVAAELTGYSAAILDLDPQGTAEAWGGWRKDVPPVVFPAKAASLTKMLDRAREAGADIAFIDTPPLAQADATIAAKAADLVLIPCRPRAFDLHAIRLTASLMQMTGKPAFAMFNGGHPSATASYAEPEEVVAAIGLKIAPFRLADRAPYHQAVMTGQAAQEIEPSGRAAAEVTVLWEWLCKQIIIKSQKHFSGAEVKA
jgi:chromosome partitioning protein